MTSVLSITEAASTAASARLIPSWLHIVLIVLGVGVIFLGVAYIGLLLLVMWVCQRKDVQEYIKATEVVEMPMASASKQTIGGHQRPSSGPPHHSNPDVGSQRYAPGATPPFQVASEWSVDDLADLSQVSEERLNAMLNGVLAPPSEEAIADLSAAQKALYYWIVSQRARRSESHAP